MKLIVSTFLVYKVKKCLLKSGKVIPTIRQTYPRLCPTLPKALGTYAQNHRLIVLMFSGIRAHVHGHKSSCTWAQTQDVTFYPLLCHFLPFTIYVVTFLYYKTGKIDYIAFYRRENALKIRKETL